MLHGVELASASRAEERTSRVNSVPIASGVSVDRDVPVRMHDGVQLMANVYRPVASSPAPVLLSVTPYSKDATPDRISMLLMRLAGVRFGKLECSRWTGFESPDPLFCLDGRCTEVSSG